MNPYEIHAVDTPRRLLCSMIACLRIEGIRSSGYISLAVCETYIGNCGPIVRTEPRIMFGGDVDYSEAIVDALKRLASQQLHFYGQYIPPETKELIRWMQHVTSKT